MDIYNLFHMLPGHKKVQLVKDLDVMTDDLISNKILKGDEVENHISDLTEFAKEIGVVSTYTNPDEVYNEVD